MHLADIADRPGGSRQSLAGMPERRRSRAATDPGGRKQLLAASRSSGEVGGPQHPGMASKAGPRRNLIATVAAITLLACVPSLEAQATFTKRAPRNALEDVDRIGDRNVTGILNLFSMRQETRLGRNVHQRVMRGMKMIDDPVITEYVNRIGQNLARNSDIKVPLVIQVAHDESINAAAMPGGYFYVNSGLIQFASDEAELAGVMGHEIVHIAGRHTTRQISRTKLINMTAETLLRSFGGDNWGTAVAVIAANVALPLTYLSRATSGRKPTS